MTERAYADLSDEELRTVLARHEARLSAMRAEYFEMVRELDSRPGSVPGARAGTEARTFLRMLRVDRPEQVVRTARVLADLPQLEKALTAGEVNPAHVRIAERTVRAIRRADPHALAGGGLEQVDTCLTDAARDLAPREFAAAAKHLLARLDLDPDDTIDPHATERRELVTWDDPTGFIGVQGLLDPVTGAWLRAALDRWSKPHPAADDEQGEVPIRDTRSKRQRQADALQLACRIALGSTRTDLDRPHVVIHARRDTPTPQADADHTGPLPTGWFQRMLCDSTIEQLQQSRDGDILHLGRTARTAPPALRRALIARDRTCVIPNCTTPAAWSDAHHIQWWSKDGNTDADNLAMICGPHHTAVHAGEWHLEMRNGIPWAQPPTWLDPHQQWRRNTYQHHRRTTEQLALNLRPGVPRFGDTP
jgi:hypothetical protein